MPLMQRMRCNAMPCDAMRQFVDALLKCHEDHKIGKWFGACNDAKAALDLCFKVSTGMMLLLFLSAHCIGRVAICLMR